MRGVAQFGSAPALGAGCRRFKSYHPDLLLTIMEIFTVEEYQERWDELMERVEKGETFGIVTEDGKAAVMMPADDELIRIHIDQNNDAQ